MASKKGRRAEASLENSALLDVYTGNKETSSGSKPISKKNKNQKKRELAKQQQERRESEKTVDNDNNGEVVLDSWEDIQDTETPDVPPPPEFVIDRDAVEERRQEEEQRKKTPVQQKSPPKHVEKQSKKAQPKVDVKVQNALHDISATIGEVSNMFQDLSVSDLSKSSANQKTKSKDKVDKKVVDEKVVDKKVVENAKEVAEKKEPKDEGKKTNEKIKAEKEAKKKAKHEKKMAARAEQGVEPTTHEKQAEKKQPEKQQLSKAERRAIQEAQRAAKTAAQAEANKARVEPKADAKTKCESKPKSEKSLEKKNRVSDDIQADRASIEKKVAKKLASQNLPQRPKAQRKVMLFSHLHQYERTLSVTNELPVVGSHIHPAIVQLGLQYAEGTIQGSNARCLAFMNAMKRVIGDHVTPEDRQFSRDLDASMKTHISYLKSCRNHSVSMGNAIRLLKTKINNIKASTPENESKQMLLEAIDTFNSHVELAAVKISMTACEKIRDGDVILTYGCSSLLKSVFIRAAESGLKFRVIVADGRPKFEGREMARHLVNAGVHCTYTMVHSLTYVIGEVSKVFLGAHAVLANGYVMSRVGTSQVAMIAKAQNVPVLVCCETYKFSERVQTDSFVFNELGDPDDLIATGTNVTALEDWRDISSLNLLYLNYDVTPANLVDAIISEISVIPCTSVPVVLRLKASDLAQ